jgi:hypothetical protein
MGLRRFLAILTAALVILLAIAAWFIPLNDDFRVENPFWNGISAIAARQEAQPLKSLAGLPSSPEGTSLIVIPYLSFSTAELEQLGSFINRGGTLILADDFGYGNQVLEYLRLQARFSGESLLDPLVNYKNKQFPKITRFEPVALTTNVTSMVLNHATCLVDVPATDILALSSSFSFLDLNGNQTGDINEPAGPLPVMSHHYLGAGQIILIADPSLFINGMDMEDNAAFINNIRSISLSGLYLDQSHLPASELQETKSLLAGVRSFFASPAGIIGLLLLVLIVALSPIWYKKKEYLEEYKAE